MKATEGSDMRDPELQERRAAARRTALILALVAVAIYVGFILSGIIGRT